MLSSLFKFGKAYQDQTAAIFTDYYKATDNVREGLPDGQRPDMDKMEKLSGERDERLKRC